MKKLNFLFILFFIGIISFSAVEISQKAIDYYIEAMKLLGSKEIPEAVFFFEKAVFEDPKILTYDDKGLLNKNIEKYLKLINKEENPVYYYKLGYFYKLSGKYDEAIDFFDEFVKYCKTKASSSEKKKLKKMYSSAMRYLYELEIITGKNVISKKKDKKEEKEKNEAKSKKEGEKKLAAIKEEKKKKEEELKEKKRQALENAIENQKKIVEDLKKQYDLWFNLTYSNDKEKYKYKDVKYSSQLMYYYEDKLKAAQERLEKLEKELEALK